MFPITEITDIDLAFPARVLHLMPSESDIPPRFRDAGVRDVQLVARWFYRGLPDDTEFVPRPGVDARLALRQISAILRSFEPRHEHKMAATAFLVAEWFEDVRLPGTDDGVEPKG